MSYKRLVCSAGALLAVTGAAVLSTGGIAAAQGEHYQATNGKAFGTACPGIKSGPPSGTRSMAGNGQTVRVVRVGAPSPGPAEGKTRQEIAPVNAGARAMAGHGQAVRVFPAGVRSAGSC